MTISTIWTDFIHLFFPNLCLVCKKPLVKDEKQICISCLCRLNYCRIDDPVHNPVYELFYAKTDIQEAWAWLSYEKGGRTQKLIHALKYYNNKAVGRELGRMAAREAAGKHFFSGIDLIIPVPLHRKKKIKRGYNQAEIIAGSISEVYNVPVEALVLQRKKQAPSQVKKSLYERWINTQYAFIVENEHLLAGKHILLVDDVITSGSTLSACCDALSQVGDIRISIFSLAVAY